MTGTVLYAGSLALGTYALLTLGASTIPSQYALAGPFLLRLTTNPIAQQHTHPPTP